MVRALCVVLVMGLQGVSFVVGEEMVAHQLVCHFHHCRGKIPDKQGNLRKGRLGSQLEGLEGMVARA